MIDLGIWRNKLDHVYKFGLFYLLFGTWCSSLCPVYVIYVLTWLGTRCFIHLSIELSIVLPLAPGNGNIRGRIFLSLLVFCKGVSFCTVINERVLMNGYRLWIIKQIMKGAEENKRLLVNLRCITIFSVL